MRSENPVLARETENGCGMGNQVSRGILATLVFSSAAPVCQSYCRHSAWLSAYDKSTIFKQS